MFEWVPLILVIHVLGAIIWVGGNISLAIAVWGIRRSFPNQPETVSRVISEVGRAFAWVMWPALAATLATGLANLSWYTPPAENWTGIPGAEWIVTSFAVAALMVISAGLHTFVVGPRIRVLRSRRTPSPQLTTLVRFNHVLEALTLMTAILIVIVMVILASL
ncbi:MAG TPA: CopD family protein [Thermoplasmata archaeon]|nr:CopD family protein [Thermoplasmata archaeon]